MTSQLATEADVAAIAGGYHGDPFSVLGPHARESGGVVLRAFLPQALEVSVVAEDGSVIGALQRIDARGFFAGEVRALGHYRFQLLRHDGVSETVEDPYRFGLVLGELDVYLLAQGKHGRLHQVLGAHSLTLDGVNGYAFAVWAPNARRVAVVGDFNDWDGRRHPMRRRPEAGVWELFLPEARTGQRYKFELRSADGFLLPLKADPLARAMERPPATASIATAPLQWEWNDGPWLARRARVNERDEPISIYEVHLGSWRRGPGNRYLTYGELAEQLVPYAVDLGFTHLELMPVSEYPFDGSWGYQALGLFAPTSRFGEPADFAAFVDAAHAAGLGVIVDWVPGHFPTDAHGLGNFDGTHLYEHADPHQGFQPDWNTLVYNFGRSEVRNFLIDNARFWFDEFHVDGLRVDAVASMLYLDYSRQPGEWVPNEHGGNENLAAIEFLRTTNEEVYGQHPGITMIAEESTSWPRVSAPVYVGGLGFGYKWNMGWMHDTLAYLREDPINRKYHHDKMTFGLLYAFSENFVLPLSHDEVVHGKGSLIGKMPGDEWQRFANLRAYYGFMWCHPGKKLLFMGGEFAQYREWNHDRGLDWNLLEFGYHRGVYALVRDLNRLYASTPALYELDCEAAGFRWIDADDRDASTFSFARFGRDANACVIAVANFTPVVRSDVRLGVPLPGTYREALNTDAAIYGGSGVSPGAQLISEPIPHNRYEHSLVLTLPPLSALALTRVVDGP